MILRILSVAVIGLVIFAYFLYHYFFSVNFPFQDDFLLIQFIDAITQKQTSLGELVTELFRTFNDHKAVVPRLIALLNYKLTGHLNFRFYIVLVLINVIYIFGFVWIQFRKMRLPVYYFLPAPFLFFHPLFHDVSGWALNGMQHSFLTAFTVTAILLVSSRKPAAFYVAMLCCFLATFTHGNGILSFPAIVFYFLCFKDFRNAIKTCVFTVICLVLYLADYESGQAVNLPKSAASFFSSFFGFIGSEMSLWENPKLFSVVWGIVILAFMTYLVVRVARIYFDKKALTRPGTVELLTFFAFIVITSLVVAVFRSWTESTIASRFQIYAALSTVIFYILLVEYTAFFKRKSVLIAVTGLSVIYWTYSHYRFTGVVATKKATYLADLYNWPTNRDMYSVEKSLLKNADFYLTPAYQKGFFHLPPAVTHQARLDSLFRANATAAGNYQMEVETWTVARPERRGSETLNLFFLTSMSAPQPKHILADRFLVLRDKERNRFHLMCANPKTEGRKRFFTGSPYYKPGFNTLIRHDDLAPGSYDLGLLDVENDGRQTFYKLDRALQVGDGRIALQ
ncbi:hypothetical protein GCM10010967_32700 [Dyadobacter beijingensis]|uniref:EpsG family protein n=1 Tax=Dyadobacter beijingensis TaxID=365489 RepID=A0ABQ2HZW4_9BACT|nr:hypothetical protein [Dyadobacter beijingensis]GGM96470.1 hypothetical protein GCM10010967_32700 [Dyadobacter beijingensis]